MMKLRNKSGKVATANPEDVKVTSNPNGTWKVTVKGKIFSAFTDYFAAIEWIKEQK